MEIEMFFCRYDIDGDFKVNFNNFLSLCWHMVVKTNLTVYIFYQFDAAERNKILNDLNFGRMDEQFNTTGDVGGSSGGVSLEEFNL